MAQLKLTDVTDRVRSATEMFYQELIDAEAAAVIGAGRYERTDDRSTQRNGTLGLQTYLTAAPKESCAWTIAKGATAPQAAGVIHTDFERGFIKTEIVSFDDVVEFRFTV